MTGWEAATGVPLPCLLQFDQVYGAVLRPILLKPLRERPFLPDNRTTGRSGLFLLHAHRTGQGFGPGERRVGVLGTRRDRGGLWSSAVANRSNPERPWLSLYVLG
jgi:hypothetical protein